jgi:uracil phosphoribosyltransferase
MRTRKTSPRAVGQARRQQEVDPELRELLDHLGRLLAQEYMRLLAGEPVDGQTPRREKDR